MDLNATASLILNGISTIASVVQSYLAYKQGGSKPEPGKDPDGAAGPGPLHAEPEEVSTLARIIDNRILIVIQSNISVARSRLITVLEDEKKSAEDKDQAVAEACRSVCAELRRIRQFNRGVLPTRLLERISLSFGCAEG
jgi:hypothetical protein